MSVRVNGLVLYYGYQRIIAFCEASETKDILKALRNPAAIICSENIFGRAVEKRMRDLVLPKDRLPRAEFVTRLKDALIKHNVFIHLDVGGPIYLPLPQGESVESKRRFKLWAAQCGTNT